MALKRWDLLNATELQFGQEMATINQIGSVWPDATVYICECMDDDFNETIQFAVSSAGRLISNPQVGDGYEVCDYNTRELVGTFTVMNVVSLKGGKITKKANDRFVQEDAPVLVFK